MRLRTFLDSQVQYIRPPLGTHSHSADPRTQKLMYFAICIVHSFSTFSHPRGPHAQEDIYSPCTDQKGQKVVELLLYNYHVSSTSTASWHQFFNMGYSATRLFSIAPSTILQFLSCHSLMISVVSGIPYTQSYHQWKVKPRGKIRCTLSEKCETGEKR